MKPARITVAFLLPITFLVAEASLAAETPTRDEPFFDLQRPFFESQTRPGHWLPTITVAKDGSVLVFRDRRDKGIIEVHRSEDGGKSWAKPVTVGNLVRIEGDTFDDASVDEWLAKSLGRLRIEDMDSLTLGYRKLFAVRCENDRSDFLLELPQVLARKRAFG